MKKDGVHASSQEGWVGLVYTLCIDMIKSTNLSLTRTTQEQNLFNSYLVRQIIPHMKHLDLDDEIAQFTGDGWFVMTEKEWKVPALCCFAYIMAFCFRKEMSNYTGLELETISSLRLGISSGLDMSVYLPDGTRHWVGDSARRSIRSSNCCYDNEVLIDYSVLRNFLGVIKTDTFDIEKRIREFPGIKMEEMPDLIIMEDINHSNWRKIRNPECFVYTLNQLSRVTEAQLLAKEIASYIASTTDFDNDEKLYKWNKLIDNLATYSTALKMRDEMLKSGVSPSLETYNILMSKAPSYFSSMSLMKELLACSIEPDIKTYNILLRHVAAYKDAYKLFKEAIERGLYNIRSYEILMEKTDNPIMANRLIAGMKKTGLSPTFNMYIKLIRLAYDYDDARQIIDDMEAAGILPNAVTYSLLLKKVNSFDEAEVLMEEMEERGIPTDLVFE